MSRSEETSNVDIWSKSAPGTENGECKGPEVATWLVCSRHNRRVGMDEVERLRGRVGGQEVR